MRREKGPYDPTWHRDGTVTYWSVYEKVWRRLPIEDVYDDDETMASQGDKFRLRAERYVDRVRRGQIPSIV